MLTVLKAVRAALAVVVAVLLGACLDAASPEGPVLCASNGECPAGQVCLLARHVCAPAGTKAHAPAVVDVRFEPAIASGGAVTLVVTADEALDNEHPALVTFAEGTPALALAFATSEGAEQRFIVDADAADEGVYRIASVSVTDEDGDSATREINGAQLVVDRTPPTLFNALLEDAPADRIYADLAGRSSVHVRALANEPLLDDAAFELAGISTACTLDGSAVDCVGTIDSSTPDGLADVVVTVHDSAGNLQSVHVAQIRIDTAPPFIVEGSADVRVSDAAGTVTVSLLSSEDLSLAPLPTAFVDIAPTPLPLALVASDARRLTFSINGFGVPEDAPIRATFSDVVGHLPVLDVAPFPAVSGCPGSPARPTCFDFDGDGHFGKSSCPVGEGDDDDDFSPLVFPGALEIAGDGVDNDGIGGDLAIADGNGVFVDSELGDDAALGTRAAPVRTLGVAGTLGAQLFLITRTTPYEGVTDAAALIGVDTDPTDAVARARITAPHDGVTGQIVLAHVELLAGFSVVILDPDVAVLDSLFTVFATPGSGHRVTLVGSHIGTLALGNFVAGQMFDCDIDNITFDGGTFALESSVVHSGISFGVGGGHLIASNSVLEAPFGGDVVSLRNSTVELFHNTLIANGGPAMNASNGGVQTLTIINNLFLGVDDFAFLAIVPDEGIFVGNASNKGFIEDNTLPGNLENVDPGLLSLFHLSATSEVRDAAVDAVAFGAPTTVMADFDRDCRYADGAPDIGVDEVP